MFQPDAPFNMTNLSTFTKNVGKKPALVMWYQPWGSGGRNKFQANKVRQLKYQGVVPLISWEPWNPGSGMKPKNNPSYSLRRINSGAFDSYIRRWARGAKASETPMMIRPMHEMNGTWYPWGGTINGNSPEQYTKAWRRIHTIFEKEGATNVSRVWSINEHSVPRTDANGFSGFNFGTGEGWSTWRHVGAIYDDSYRATIRHGNKAAWIEENMGVLPERYPRIKAVVWWNSKDRHNDFRCNSSKSSASAFRRAIADPTYLSRATMKQSGP